MLGFVSRHPARVGIACFAVIAALLWRAGAFTAMEHQDPLPHHPTRYADGSYAFIEDQPKDPSMPVGYNPCHGVPVYINYDQAPARALSVVRTSIQHVNWASGMHLYYAGATQAGEQHPMPGGITVLFTNGPRGAELAYTDDWRWTETYEHYLYIPLSTVTFNLTQMNGESSRYWQATSDHEFGHAVGLAHVSSKKELMYPYAEGLAHYGHGDLTGLAVLGSLPCS